MTQIGMIYADLNYFYINIYALSYCGAHLLILLIHTQPPRRGAYHKAPLERIPP